MKNSRRIFLSDEICGKESADYINEFSPHRLSLIHFEENSERIFEIDEEKPFRKRDEPVI